MSESPFLLIRNENKRFGDLEKGQENKPILKLSGGGRGTEQAEAADSRPNNTSK